MVRSGTGGGYRATVWHSRAGGVRGDRTMSAIVIFGVWVVDNGKIYRKTADGSLVEVTTEKWREITEKLGSKRMVGGE